MTKKKTILIIILAMIILGVGFIIWSSYGFTPKARFTNCLRDCYDLMILESSKQYCPDKCTETHKYEPTATELNEIIAELENKDTGTEKTTTTANTNSLSNANTASQQNANTAQTNTSAAVNSAANVNTNPTDDQNRSYYCNWVWYQEIIDKDTKELIYECTDSHPWCNYADYTFENVGCCVDAEHTNCITLPNLQ
ncbi:MAG: hypothetical protein V1838_03695 [Patescibacteria group bacterium]